MNFITTSAIFDRADPVRRARTQDRHPDFSPQPYAFLTARDLRGLVAAMVD